MSYTDRDPNFFETGLAETEIGGIRGIADLEKSGYDDIDDERKLYIEWFQIGPVKVNITFVATPSTSDDGYPDQDRGLMEGGSRRHETVVRLGAANTGSLYTSLSLFLGRVGEVVLGLTSTISDAPVYLTGKVVSHLFINRNLNELLSILQGAPHSFFEFIV